MSPTFTATIGLVSLLLCTLSAALPAPSNSLGHSASFRHHHRRLVLLPSQDRPLNRNDALTANSSSAPAPSINPVAVLPDTNSAQTTTSGTKLDLTKVDTWIALQAEMEALEQAEVLASATTNDLNFDDLVTDEDCDPDLAALLDPNTTSTSSNLTLSGAPNATVSKNVSTGVISASPTPHIDLVAGNATVQRGTVKADKDSDDNQKQKQDAEESRKKAKQAAEENRKKVAQDAEENRKKVEQDAEESRKKAEQDAEEARKKAEQDAEEEKTQKEAEKAAAAAKKSADEEEASKKSSEEEEASKKAADDAEAARKKAADEAKKAADASVAQVKKEEEAKKAEEGKKDDKSSEGYTAPTGHSTGDATFYGTGLGACGVTNKDSDYICAVSKLLFDEFPAPGGNPNLSEVCGKKITATYNGKSVTVTVQDRCEACKHDDLDFSPEAFNQIGHPDQGRLNGMTWTWV